MTNVYRSPEKLATKQVLFETAIDALEANGWSVERVPGAGKSSVRRITKGSVSGTASIRTSQDTWIAFPRNWQDNGWVTLSEVDYVVASSVDDGRDPKFAKVHLIAADEMRQRFERAYAARKGAKHKLQLGRGVWVSLYYTEAKRPVNRVGAGAGLTNKPIACVPLSRPPEDSPVEPRSGSISNWVPTPSSSPMLRAPLGDDEPLTIPDAKRRLAMALGVSEADIKITISS